MAKHIVGELNPWQTGLLSGIANFGSVMDKFNMIRMQNEGRLAAYQAKYGAMQQTNALKAQNTAMMKQLQMEANQRAYKTQETGPDGKVYNVSYRNTFNPETGAFEPKEIGRAAAPPDAATLLNTRLDAADSRLNTRLADQDKRQSQRDADAAARETAREQSAKQDKLDGKVEKDMDKWDQASGPEKATMLKNVGLSAPTSTEHKGVLGMGAGPNTSSNDDIDGMRDAYEKAITDKHAKTMGIKPPGQGTNSAQTVPQSGDPSSAPATTPSGQPLLKKDGQFYVKDKNGKPVPVSVDAQGNIQGAPPLAMDDQSGASPTAMPDESGASEDDQEQSPLLAENDSGSENEDEPGSQASDQEDEDDDAAQDQQSQALLA